MVAGGPVAPDDPQRAALERALGAQYEIVRLLGRGGMGAVYLARERALERLVAIKVLPPDMATDAESRERFRREARTAAKLTHPNIVPLHTFGEAEGMLYFVMGYVRGESLGERMHREGKLPPEDVRRILGELADALDYAHRQGVIHRDIKPDNVLLEDESGRPMLTDFGVAKARATGATLTEAGAVVGTPHYMSPEQASGARDLDGRSDLYSLGIMGYAMLSGRLPFEGESFRDVIVQHVTKAPPPLDAIAREAPAELVAAVTRCIAKEPGARWPDGRALREALAMDGDDEPPKLSIPLKVIDGYASDIVVSAAMLTIGAFVYPFLDAETRVMALLLGPAFMGAMFFVGTPVALAVARQRGHSWAYLRQLLLRPPRWWAMWWPASWRREDDVWHRLPPVLRRTRIAQTVAVVLGFGAVLCILSILARPPRGGQVEVVGSFLLALLAPIPVLVLGAAGVASSWGKRRGLNTAESSQAASKSTMALAFWKRRKFAALL
ncbi:MAG: serine/threonine-protein kinase, partial [Gemmatimonadales bacterium]|nr:serine/threonine-protein kinase [Gemmatimonadales bacterium]